MPPPPSPHPPDVQQPAAPPKPKQPEGPSDQGPARVYRVNVVNLRSYKEADISQMEKGIVIRAIDGDTVEALVQGKRYKIRLIGVDTPETVAPGRAVERFGKEASQFTKSRVEGKTVFLAHDWELFDRYGRLLAYLYLPDGTCFNAELIRLGYGHAYTKYPFQFLEEFRALEKEARNAKRGLWGAGTKDPPAKEKIKKPQP